MSASRLPHHSVFGRLEITDVLDTYDVPTLFVCRNGAGHHYLASWVDSVEDFDRWLFVAISERSRDDLLCGNCSVYDAFRGAADGVLIEMSVSSQNDSSPFLRLIPVADVPDIDLPSKELVLYSSA